MPLCSELVRREIRAERPKDDVDRWRSLYAKYGGSARHLFGVPEMMLEKFMSDALFGADIKQILGPSTFDDEAQHSYFLVQINPIQGDDGTVDRLFTTTQFISAHIVEELWKTRARDLLDSLKSSFEVRLASRISAGHSFEAVGHRYVFEQAQAKGPAIEVVSLEESSLLKSESEGTGVEASKSKVTLNLADVKTMHFFRVNELVGGDD